MHELYVCKSQLGKRLSQRRKIEEIEDRPQSIHTRRCRVNSLINDS